MPRAEGRSLWDLTAAGGLAAHRFVADAGGRVHLSDLVSGGTLALPLEQFRNRSVLIASERQLVFVLALLQLEGLAARIVLCPPDLAPEHLPAIAAEAGLDMIVTDGRIADCAVPTVRCDAIVRQGPGIATDRTTPTEWLLFTSGTSGRPKLVLHTLPSLAGPLEDGLVAADAVWSTFYDVRRYGGLQILLRALLGGGAMVLSQAGEPVGTFLDRAGACGVTHISGTPSHWRRALMSSAPGRMSPNYVRLSGEVADQAILDALGAAFPAARIAHAFASTEAGVAFDVADGLAGFPASLIGQTSANAELRVEDGSLRIRSARTASRYLGDHAFPSDSAGFVDTGDMVALVDGRYRFVGRREGVINVGGQKVHPEEVEAVINRHPGVQMARVRGRPSPVTGALVVADVVVRESADGRPFDAIRTEILFACRDALPPHKVPAMINAVATLDIAASGKLARWHA